MSERSDIDRVVRHWMSDGPSTMPDRVVDAVADRISRQPQRRTWRLVRRLPMNPILKLAAALAAGLIIAVVGWNLLPGQNGSGSLASPSASPSPTPSPSESPSATLTPTATAEAVRCEDDLPGCAGPLEAGAHRSTAFKPSLTYSTRAGWANVVDTPTIFKLDPESSADPYLIVWSNVAIANGCDPVVKPGTGRKVQDFVSYLTSHPGLDVLTSKPVSVGHFRGRAMDLAVKPSWTETCPGIGGFTVDFILDTDPIARPQVYGLTNAGNMHVLLVDVNGRTVIIQAYGPTSGAGFADAMAKVQPLVDSFDFSPGG